MWKTFSSGVDWFTTTAGKDSDEIGALDDLGLELLSESLKEAHQIHKQNIEGYQGTRMGSVFVGFRNDGMMLQVTGGAAHQAAGRLKERVPNAKLSRIDFEITVQGEDGDEHHARRLYREIDAKDFRTPKGRRFSAEVKHRPRRGDTLYVGSPTSDRYGRVYNKTAEQRGKVAPNLWRYEVEHHRKPAQKAWAAFCASDSPTSITRDVVVATFEDKGLDMSFVDNSTPHRLPTSYEPTDDERRLEWLSSHVSKTVRQLEDRLGAEAVAKALGLKFRP